MCLFSLNIPDKGLIFSFSFFSGLNECKNCQAMCVSSDFGKTIFKEYFFYIYCYNIQCESAIFDVKVAKFRYILNFKTWSVHCGRVHSFFIFIIKVFITCKNFSEWEVCITSVFPTRIFALKVDTISGTGLNVFILSSGQRHSQFFFERRLIDCFFARTTCYVATDLVYFHVVFFCFCQRTRYLKHCNKRCRFSWTIQCQK